MCSGNHCDSPSVDARPRISEADGVVLDKPKLRTEGVGDPSEGLLGGVRGTAFDPTDVRLVDAGPLGQLRLR